MAELAAGLGLVVGTVPDGVACEVDVTVGADPAVIGLGVTFFGGDCCCVTGALSTGGGAAGFLGEGVLEDVGKGAGIVNREPGATVS